MKPTRIWGKARRFPRLLERQVLLLFICGGLEVLWLFCGTMGEGWGLYLEWECEAWVGDAW